MLRLSLVLLQGEAMRRMTPKIQYSSQHPVRKRPAGSKPKIVSHDETFVLR
jgi:hypothetical protein